MVPVSTGVTDDASGRVKSIVFTRLRSIVN